LICLFGGTFDPVHLGHLHAAEAVCQALDLSEISLVLSARPSHKDTTGASVEDRWAMLSLACADRDRLRPDDREVHRPQLSFTVETLRELRARHPQTPLAWVIGSDAYALLPSWYEWREVLELANLVVLKRPGHSLNLDDTMRKLTAAQQVDSLADCHHGGILLLDTPMREVSAEKIRAILRTGGDAGHLLPGPVAIYIKEHGLYDS
jgi:nicotinate-nucleotide adenylyltransferase